MKTLKYFLIGAMMMGFTAPLSAQDDHKAVIDELTKVIKSKASDSENQVKNLFKPFKKEADVMVAIGRAYLDIKDTANATKYADMAIKRDKAYGNAYVLRGDIEVAKDNGGEASAWYENATYFDPKNPEGYRRYAMVNSKTSPSASVAKLEELRKQLPDYPVDIISAEIYDKAGNIDKAIEYYEKVDKAKMDEYQLANFALEYFLKGKFEKSLEVSQFGNGKFPKNPALNRLSFFNLTNLKRYEEALTYADALFNKSTDTKITESDYLYYGYAYLGNKKYDEAIAMFQKSIENNTNNDEDRNDALKNIAEAYKEKGDFDNAVATYQKYLDGLKERTALDFNNLAQMYTQQAETVKADAAKYKEYLLKADAIYGQMAEKMPSAAEFATYQRAHIGFSLDPETKEGAAKPHYEKLIEMINAKSQKDDKDNSRLVEAYRYLGYYYMVKDDKANSDIYWNKILEIDPTNETAKQALGK